MTQQSKVDRTMRERLHSRTMTIETFDTGEETITVEGTLEDRRFFSSRAFSRSGTVEPGFIHHLTVTMKLALPRLEITDIEAGMPVIPHAECIEIKDAVKRLKHIVIRPGFTDEVQRLFGKTQGCIHMMNLILAMGSAAVQGMWSYYSRKKMDDGQAKMPDVDETMLLDSCWVWRKDGPFVEKLKKTHR
jgi:hypothetical protein